MKNDSTPKDEIIECSCGECYKKSYHGVVCPNCAKVNKPVAESTPSEGWASEIHRQLEMNAKMGRIDGTLEEALCLIVEREIAKARQEARQECAEKIKNMTIETVGNSAKTVDQIIKELEE